MKRIYQILVLLLSFSVSFNLSASTTLNELAKLEAYKLEQEKRTEYLDTKKEKRLIQLSNGKKMDISDWQIVHFMSSDCSYCRQFNPVLKKISEDTKIPVFTYSFDGVGDEYFDTAFPVNNSVLNAFFAELPRATPTDFIVNVNTLVTLPLSQGATSYMNFLKRLDEVFMYVDQHLNDIK
ncbi:conjugal transfer protein TraF [Pasteurella multocida]|uniref:conjugal transfer protein TraF n=1 Tax=Pasteurella multocida TaxID=747 RepID=UPI001480D6A1|nr:conjugal transfer protein TraF [Pasteurella multocida]NNH97758.1 type-F conjugative transfer system pilin assembly thiol-disulfide isomerase TrbB [Pasteurella multocida]NNI42899.1 type-F conjugative transfer system pilin assembly thiol-disulfide isomerase TrbB [Pasteurella multocida]